MENNIENLLQPFWICCDAIWPYQHPCYLLTFDGWCLSWRLGWFHGLLYQWHPHFLKEHGRAWMPCTFGFGEGSRSGLYAKLEKCEFH